MVTSIGARHWVEQQLAVRQVARSYSAFRSACVGLSIAVAACGGKSERHGASQSSGGTAGGAGAGAFAGGMSSSPGGRHAGGSAGAAGSSTPQAGVSGVGGEGGALASCSQPTVPSVPLRRLSPFEYDNTVRDLLGVTTRPATSAFGAPAGSEQEPASASDVELYHELAHDLALELTRDTSRLARVIGCADTFTPEVECRARLIDELVPQLFRAPLPSDVREPMDAAFDNGAELGGTFASGARAVLELALQSPEFLYRVERGEPAPEVGPSVGRPSSYEMAARLSYFLRGGPPDPELRAAAAADQLKTKAQIKKQARRLVADEDARQVLAHFHLNHLGLLQPDWAKQPQLGAELAELMTQEVAAFVAYVAFAGSGDLRGLLTEPVAWVNGPLAAHYGMRGVAGTEFRPVAEPAQRAGLLTLGAFLSGRALAQGSNPAARGAGVRRALFCTVLPGHPGNGPQAPPPAGVTTRDRFLLAGNSSPTCAACHRLTDPIGFAFEHYDGLGRFRETEAGAPIDTTGEIVGSDVQGPFDGAVELGSRLAASVDVHACYADKWLSFAYGRDQLEEDRCSREALHTAFRDANGNIVELLVAVTQTDGFLYRPLSEVAP